MTLKKDKQSHCQERYVKAFMKYEVLRVWERGEGDAPKQYINNNQGEGGALPLPSSLDQHLD